MVVINGRGVVTSRWGCVNIFSIARLVVSAIYDLFRCAVGCDGRDHMPLCVKAVGLVAQGWAGT